jgi:hypothetical protein
MLFSLIEKCVGKTRVVPATLVHSFYAAENIAAIHPMTPIRSQVCHIPRVAAAWRRNSFIIDLPLS